MQARRGFCRQARPARRFTVGGAGTRAGRQEGQKTYVRGGLLEDLFEES